MSIIWERLNVVLEASDLSEAPAQRFRVAILVSGSGSNMDALIHATETGFVPSAEVAVVISNRAEAGALRKAESRGVETVVIASKTLSDSDFQSQVLKTLLDHRIDIVCLAGYLKKVGPEIVQTFSNRILNIHPGLLPKYGGAGMYGHFVHEAVLKAGDVESGCSVHLVDNEFDHGRVLAQVHVPVLKTDTPERLAARVLQEEHKLYPQVLKKFCDQLIARDKQRGQS